MNKNKSESTIQSRILSIKKLLNDSSLQSINLLKNMDDGLETPFEIFDGDLWEVANGGETYASFIRDQLDRL